MHYTCHINKSTHLDQKNTQTPCANNTLRAHKRGTPSVYVNSEDEQMNKQKQREGGVSLCNPRLHT